MDQNDTVGAHRLHGPNACRICGGQGAGLPRCCPGRALAPDEVKAITEHRVEIIADDRGVRIYAIDDSGVVFRDWNGERDALTVITRARDTGLESKEAVDAHVKGHTAQRIAAAAADDVQRTVGIDDPVAVMFQDGLMTERRRGTWIQVPGRSATDFRYDDDANLHVTTEDGVFVWDGRNAHPVEPEAAIAPAVGG